MGKRGSSARLMAGAGMAGSLLLLLLVAGTAQAATATYTKDSYFDIENASCTTNWACSSGPGGSSVDTAHKLWEGFTYCATGGPCRADVFQGHKPWGWGTAPYNMPRVNFVGGTPPWEKWVDVSFRQINGFNCRAWPNCWEIVGLRIWADFGGQTACRTGSWGTLCSTDGVVEFALLYGFEEAGWLACTDRGYGTGWIWQSSGGKSWWEYCYWAAYQNPTDGQWYTYTTGLTTLLASVAQSVGRQPGQGYIFMIGGQVEDLNAYGTVFQITTLRFWGERGL